MKTKTAKQRAANHPHGTTRARRAVPVWFATLALAAGLVQPAGATTYNDAADGNWSASATWGVGSGYPSTVLDTAIIDQPRSITVDVSVAIGSLNISGNAIQGLRAASPQTLTVNSYTNGNINTFTLDTNVTLNIVNDGIYTTRGGVIHGTLNVLGGATLSYTTSQGQSGTGLLRVFPGATLSAAGSTFGPGTGGTLDNDGLVDLLTATRTVAASSVTGDGEWRLSGGGGVNFSNGGMVLSLNPATVLFSGSGGAINFTVANATHNLGAFSLSGGNTVSLLSAGTFNINRASTFFNLALNGASSTVDFNPAGGSPVTHTVSGLLSVSGNAVQKLTSTDPAGAVVNASNFSSGNVNTFTIDTNVTVNLLNTGSYSTRGGVIHGRLNVANGATLTYAHFQGQSGAGTLSVAAGGTVEIKSGASIAPAQVVNNGLVVSRNATSNLGGTIGGTGTFRAETGYTLTLSSASVTGWSGSGTLGGSATWNPQGTGIIDLPGSDNSINTIGANANVILENGGILRELNAAARNALTVNGELHVRGTSVLTFNSGQNLTIASGGTLGGDGTITGSGASTVSIQNGGTVSPGASPGTLTVPDLMLAAGGVYRYEGFDLLAVTGQLTLSNDWVLAFVQNGRIADSGSLTLFTFGTTNAAPAAFDLTPVMVGTNASELGFVPTGPVYLDVVGNSLVLFGLQAVPEPSVLLLLFGGGCVLGWRRRRVGRGKR